MISEDFVLKLVKAVSLGLQSARRARGYSGLSGQ